ncbi:DsbA family oxidoreductase [Aspergillus clavatus NRRL 1]|uniref:Thioredoxin, putative n=1 Tax=Aspergillus clavatus (strain ATCC 1007 / CBS 513.65 / DSM 816 / NCTC 3887 / NRRL 1 / QM 1276 / 107) TaxID=344612 RepID=A1CQU2_ASPCL|nr:thioredoxin, putative [Aspergillus clavatus NRRL 1]EAW08013.1 thioredoxin, putative [Aspergillus clavatus NRRL 1]
MTNITIQIVSDTVCPWCYIGLRRLSRAITTHRASHPTDTFTLTWQPFYLNPQAPAYPGTNKREHYASKFGGERARAIFARLAGVGAGEDIAFAFGGQTGRTRDSHRVLWYAGRKERERELRGGEEGVKEEKKEEGVGIGGLQTRVAEQLFRAYFEEEKNITDRGVLVEAAAAAGLDRAEVERFLESGDEGGKEVDLEAERARQRLVTGVPYFTVQGRYAVEGADEPDTFLEIFEKVKQVV